MIREMSRDHKKDWWLSELHSLGIHPKKINAVNDIQELRTLTDNIKQTFYQHVIVKITISQMVA
jgi:rhamnogalacturonyl hydrolase YesR